MRTLKRIAVIAVSFVLTASVCLARLGETLDQCAARYGQAVRGDEPLPKGEIGSPSATFKLNEYLIKVVCLNGVVGLENIGKVDGSEISDSEIANILAAESAGKVWTKDDKASPNARWNREDGATALYDSSDHHLTLESKDYRDAQDIADKYKGF